MATSLQSNEPLQMEMDEQQSVKNKKKNKCHGNRKKHHFIRKWIARGKTKEEALALWIVRGQTETEVTNILIKRNTNANNDNTINQRQNNSNSNKFNQKKTPKKSNKRKRLQRTNEQQKTTITQSMSRLSVSQPSPPKKKLKTNEQEKIIAYINNNSLPSKYLTMPKKLLLHSLRLQLNHPIKKKKGKRFILSRLKFLDRQFCLSMDLYLYQSYFAKGSRYKLWPDDIINMAQATDYEEVEKFLKEYLVQLQQKFDQCTTRLINESKFCPKGMQLALIESHLKEFVRLHHLDLTRKFNYQVNKFKNDIHEKELFLQLSSYSLTNEQQQIIERLSNLRQKQVETFREMTTLEVRILCRILPKSINDLDQIIPSDQPCHRSNLIDNNSNNNNHLYELIKKQQKIIRDYKRQALAKLLEDYESIIEQNEFLYQEELINFRYQLFDEEGEEENDQTKNNLMNCLNNYLHWKTMNKIYEIRYNETIVRYKLLHPRHRRSLITNNTVSIYPEAILEIFEKVFTKKELDFLSSLGGPGYIRLNQSFLHHKKKIIRNVRAQHSIIISKLTSDLNRRRGLPNLKSLIKQFSEQLEILFNQRSTISLSYQDKYRTRHDLKLLLSIKRKLKRVPVIVRETDKSRVLHFGYKSHYDRKVLIYQEKTNAYIDLSSDPLIDTFHKVVRLVNDLRATKEITAWQHQKMMPNQKKIKLAYLYFIPKAHKEGTPLRPIVSSLSAPTTGISKMLDQLIRPLFDEHVQTTTFIDGINVIRRLEWYVSLGFLKPTTLLCTSDVTDLYTMLPQEDSIRILKLFLSHFGYTHIQGMTISAIESLARIVLTENVFIYENKYYRQVKGGAMGSPFTLTLANIFMWDWERKLVEQQTNAFELYGRYIDDIFITSNKSIEELQQSLEDANNRHPNIKLTSTIDNPIPFLDVQIENIDNNLITSVYHKPAAEPYIIPFKSDHPRHIFVNIIECALLRALRYSSTLKEFNQERRAIKLILLYNGYPTKYIYTRFSKFFDKYSITSTSIIPMIHDENEFFLTRRLILDQPTTRDHRRAKRLAKKLNYNNFDTNIHPLIKEKLLKRKQIANSIFLHYTHEQRFSHYKSEIHQLWKNTFQNTPIDHLKLIVGNRNNPKLSKELVRKSPYIKTPTIKKKPEKR